VTHVQYLHKKREHILLEIEKHSILGKYSDILHRSDMIKAFQNELVGRDDIILMFSIVLSFMHKSFLHAEYISESY